MTEVNLHIAIVDLAGGDERSLTPFLERLGCRVTPYRMGRPMDLVRVLSGHELYARTDHLILDAHGCDGSILVPEVDASVLLADEPAGPWTPAHVAKFGRLPPVFVLCTGCSTGSPDMAEAMLHAGARAYLAPEGYPDAVEGLFFEQRFYYELIHHRCTEDEAVRRAQREGGDASLYRLFPEHGARAPL